MWLLVCPDEAPALSIRYLTTHCHFESFQGNAVSGCWTTFMTTLRRRTGRRLKTLHSSTQAKRCASKSGQQRWISRSHDSRSLYLNGVMNVTRLTTKDPLPKMNEAMNWMEVFFTMISDQLPGRGLSACLHA